VIGVLVAVVERHLGFRGLVGYAGARLDDEGPFHRAIGSFRGAPISLVMAADKVRSLSAEYDPASVIAEIS
jgi:hypothetical protein